MGAIAISMTMGAVIGYVTNWVVVKMIFWPRREWRVLGVRVPFTPGVFARRRGEIAREVAVRVDNGLAGDVLFLGVFSSFPDGFRSRVFDRHPELALAAVTYFASHSSEQFLSDCRQVSEEARAAGIVSTMVEGIVVGMGDEIEDAASAAVGRELRAVTWLGGVLGAVIGAAQALLT